ncbi:MAG: cytochrome c [Proteobacteria bacterium]|nr:cytochrome c [Pseudomonadota bacterium]
MVRWMGLSLVIMVSAAPLASTARSEDADVEKLAAQGESILKENCSRCHATGRTGDSPRAEAPPFRTLSRKYPIRNLAEALAEGITTGHPDMPEFVFSADEIAAILTYMERISDVPSK